MLQTCHTLYTYTRNRTIPLPLLDAAVALPNLKRRPASAQKRSGAAAGRKRRERERKKTDADKAVRYRYVYIYIPGPAMRISTERERERESIIDRGKESIRKVALGAGARSQSLSLSLREQQQQQQQQQQRAPEKYNETPAINNASVATGAPYNSFLPAANSPSPSLSLSHTEIHTYIRAVQRERALSPFLIAARPLPSPRPRYHKSARYHILSLSLRL